MRYFLFISALLLAPLCARATPSSTEDLASIPLVPNSVYDPRNEGGREFKELFSGMGVLVMGPNTDLTQTISEKLDLPALRKYLPSAAERTLAARRIANDVTRRFLSRGYSNQNVNNAMQSATDQLVQLVVPRILQKEGVKNSARAKIWANKILAPFDHCMSLAISYIEGKNCSDPLESSLMKNIGLAMTYELSLQEFGLEAAASRPLGYDQCLKPELPGADARVRACAVEGVRKSASSFGRSRLNAVARKRMPMAAADILTAQLMPAFDKCLAKTADRGGFVKCGDKLIETAGAAIAGHALLTDARIHIYFPAETDREHIATKGHQAFARCMGENEKSGRRDANGTLETSNCESFVTLETARVVAGEVFRNTIEKNLPDASSADRAAMLTMAKARLAECWDSQKTEKENGMCLRAVAKRTAVDLADRRLDSQLPPDVRDQKLHARLLSGFSDCLEKRLPIDLLHSDGATAAAAACGAETVHNASLAVAEVKVRAVLQGKLDDTKAVDKLVELRVHKDFGTCLGDQPDSARIDSCSLALQKSIALDSAEALIPRKVDEFFQKAGGIETYGLTEAQRQNILTTALSSHAACLQREVKSANSASDISACFKSTVRDLVLQLATLELTRQAKANGLDVTTASFAQTARDLGASFSMCLDKRRDPKFSLDDYLGGLSGCQTELTKTFSSQLAKKELAGVARQVLGESAGELEHKLGDALDQCMAKAEDANATGACVATLRSEGTVEIAKAGVRSRAGKELNGKLPPDFSRLEAVFDTCVATNTKSTNDCAMDYLKASTKMLGHLVLDTQITKEIGAAKMAKLAPEIQSKLEDPFGQCVDAVSPPLTQKLLDALDVCGNRLTQNALDYMMHHKTDIAIESVLSYFRKPKKQSYESSSLFGDDLGQEELTGMMARTMLCLNDRPSGLEPLKNLQPGSTEDKLLQLIASYVSYDVKNARGGYEAVLQQVADELKAAGPVAARRKLLGLLTEHGAVDQLIRGLLRTDLQKSLAGKGIPAAITAKLTDKEFISATLKEDAMTALRPKMAIGVLEPILVDGSALGSPPVKRALLAVRNDALDLLLASPSLGADDSVREQIRQALRN